jgi:hypothetical protein
MRCIRTLITSHSPPEDHADINRRLIIKPVLLKYNGDTTLHKFEDTHQTGIFCFTDPETKSHTDFHQELLTRLFTDTQATAAIADLLGFVGVFTKHLPHQSGIRVNSSDIPTALAKRRIYWLSLANVPHWLNECHLHIILVWSFKIMDIGCIFPHCANLNTAQTSMEYRKLPHYIITFNGVENMKRLINSSRQFNEVIVHLNNSRGFQSGINTPLPRVSLAILHGSSGPTANTPIITPELLSMTTLNALVSDKNFPASVEAPTAKRSHEEEEDDDSPELCLPSRLKALDLVCHHMANDPSDDTIQALFLRMAAIEDLINTHNDILTQGIAHLYGGQYFQVVDTRLWTPNSQLEGTGLNKDTA